MKYFISHSTKDEQLALWVGSVLHEEFGYEIKMPEFDIRHGNNHINLICEVLNSVDAVVLILTKAYLDSRNCQEELKNILLNVKKLLPLKFEDFKIGKGFLGDRVYLDLTGLEEETAKEALIKALKRVERPSDQPPFPKVTTNIRAKTKVPNLPTRNPFEGFTESEAITFLKQKIKNINDYEANILSKKLGYLPLALSCAATYINESKLQCSKYILLLDKYGLKFLDKSCVNIDYTKIITACLQISIDQIKDEATRQLLNLCAYCAPDNIPIAMFIDGREELPHPLKDALAPDNALEHTRVAKELTKYGLLSLYTDDKGDVFLSIHRKIQEVVINGLLDNIWFKYCLNMADRIFRYEYGNLLSMNKFILTLPHVMQIADHGNIKISEGAETLKKISQLYFEAGVGSDFEGDYNRALEFYSKALAIYEKVLGKEHPDTATTYNNMAVVYADQCNYEKAMELYEKALAIREKVHGKEHPDTATTYNNIAGIYADQGDSEKAIELYEKALAIFEQVHGEEHRDTAATYNNMAVVYADQCNYEKAIEFNEKALAIREQVHGEEHRDTAAT